MVKEIECELQEMESKYVLAVKGREWLLRVAILVTSFSWQTKKEIVHLYIGVIV